MSTTTGNPAGSAAEEAADVGVVTSDGVEQDGDQVIGATAGATAPCSGTASGPGGGPGMAADAVHAAATDPGGHGAGGHGPGGHGPGGHGPGGHGPGGHGPGADPGADSARSGRVGAAGTKLQPTPV